MSQPQWRCHTCGDRLYANFASMMRRHGDHELQRRCETGRWETWLRPAPDIEKLAMSASSSTLTSAPLNDDPLSSAMAAFEESGRDRVAFEVCVVRLPAVFYFGWMTALGLSDEEQHHSRTTTAAIMFDRLSSRGTPDDLHVFVNDGKRESSLKRESPVRNGKVEKSVFKMRKTA